ncbi:D-alanyl-D-alanine carboxypeptidase family protein [Sulfuriroseicoccus oceanibius]|uniref:D-alanyl-D-alanine carboxypeptidase n=1 Tax=Sulfuriroseicoccus oceanibius TaxID=2707525 RepID=A0A6B3LBI2_9BACT|nr:D-alanyl-D-alanine carboxypeptidase family protein [Sulfuriroseicoccus oceanibius]QQL44535.1 D-alanyl-D-alanine carboxypeptidase [Sulfuriroseicoccus oceanibius]
MRLPHWIPLIFLFILTHAASAASAPSIYGKAAIVVDADTGVVLYTKNADQRRPVASTQKLLTALLVLEKGNVNGMLTVDRSDTLVAPAKIGLRTGQQYRRIDLLRTLLVKSSNDVAHCLARDHSGSEAAFARLMTRRARQLGMVNSNFKNASGLPADGQYSTARDMARLAITSYHTPAIRAITKIETLPFRFANGRTRTLHNTNKLLKRMPGVNGLKTGYTNAAGRCLICSINRDGRNIITVVLGSSSRHIWNDSRKLLEYGLSQAK